MLTYNIGFVFFLLVGTIVALAMPGDEPVKATLEKTATDSEIAANDKAFADLEKAYGTKQGEAVSFVRLNDISICELRFPSFTIFSIRSFFTTITLEREITRVSLHLSPDKLQFYDRCK